MVATVQEAVYAMGLDGSAYTQQAAEVARANEQLLGTTAQVTQAEEKLQRATRTTADGFAKLEARYDPLIRSEQRRQAAIQQASRYLEEGSITQERYAAQLARVNAFYNQQSIAAGRATAANQNMSRAVAAGTGTSRSFGNVAQQAGFQVGDFAVQVASGQGAMRAFIQQGTQLLGVFGPWGAVIGAGVAVVGALATGLMAAGDATDETTGSMKLQEDALKRLNQEMDRYVKNTDAFADAQRSLDRSAIANQISNLETERDALIRAGVASEPRGFAQRIDRAITGILPGSPEARRAQLNELDERLKELRKAEAGAIIAERERIDREDLEFRIKQIKEKGQAEKKANEDAEQSIKSKLEAEAKFWAENEKGIEMGLDGLRRLERKRQEEIDKRLTEERKATERIEREQKRALERTVAHSTDRLVDFAGDAIFDRLTGKASSFWDSFRDYGLRAISQVAAEMVFRPLITPAATACVGGSALQTIPIPEAA